MKKLISLFVAFVLVLSACALCACDLEDVESVDVGSVSETSDKPAEETQPQNGGEQPAAPVKVDSVNGMTAKQLYALYDEMLDSFRNIDASATLIETEGGNTQKTAMTMKVGTDALYIHMDQDGEITEMTVIDGILYYNMNGQKFKMANADMDEIIGEAMSDTEGEFDDKKLDSAEIYLYAGEYYFDIQLTADESESFGYDEKEHTIRFYFDATGTLKRAVVSRDGYTETTVYNSIGKTVTISAPADAHLYEEVGGASGDVDPVLYAKYEALVGVIGNSEEFLMEIELTGMIEYYQIDSEGNEWAAVVDESTGRSEMWHVDEKGYVLSSGTIVEVNEIAVISSIQNLANLRTVITNKILASNMADLGLVESVEESVLSFYSNGYYYSFTYDSEMSGIDIVITEEDSTETVKYYFDFYDGQQTKIEVPGV